MSASAIDSCILLRPSSQVVAQQQQPQQGIVNIMKGENDAGARVDPSSHSSSEEEGGGKEETSFSSSSAESSSSSGSSSSTEDHSGPSSSSLLAQERPEREENSESLPTGLIAKRTSHVPLQQQAAEERRGASAASMSTTTSNEDENEKTAPQNDDDGEFSAEYEAVMVSQRNKRILLERLRETAPRGKLSLINLTRRNLGVDDAVLLKGAILANPQLSVLKLSYNCLGDRGVAILASALLFQNGQHHQNLSVLDLGFNSIGDAGCEALAVHALAGNYTIRTLYLSGNKIEEKGALSIAGAILHGTGVSSLHLSVNRLGVMGMKAIASAIAKNDASLALVGGIDSTCSEIAAPARRMEELYLGCSSIGSEGFIAIPGMLLSNTSLRSLCLSNNNIDDQDMMLLSQALSQNKNIPLESLQLSFNQITCQGVECLMNAVWGSKTLRELKLDNNKIQDRGAQLCAVVLTSIALEHLDLAFNRVTTVGIKALMKNISEHDALQTLGLSGIAIDQNASKAVSYALAYNCSLRALFLDNCSTGYSSQRHIVAGIVSNRRSALRVLTGFPIGPIAVTLGVPKLPEEWSNDRVLGFFRLMWKQWLLKSLQGNTSQDDDLIRGPAPPPAVAAAAKIALTALGSSPEKLSFTEPHEKPLTEASPVDPASTALLERTDSGTMRMPEFANFLDEDIDDWVDNEAKVSVMAADSPDVSTVRCPLENTEQRNRNLQWLRVHFRSLNDVGRLPFNNADLWQLHQYYFSPPFCPKEDSDKSCDSTDFGEANEDISPDSATLAPPPTPAIGSITPSVGRSVSFQALGDALAASGIMSPGSHKRRSDADVGEDDGPATKRAKSLSKPRIAYYPRLMEKVQSLGTKPMDQTLSLLRKLKYTENIIFADRNPYTDTPTTGAGDPSHADVEMILLDLL